MNSLAHQQVRVVGVHAGGAEVRCAGLAGNGEMLFVLEARANLPAQVQICESRRLLAQPVVDETAARLARRRGRYSLGLAGRIRCRREETNRASKEQRKQFALARIRDHWTLRLG